MTYEEIVNASVEARTRCAVLLLETIDNSKGIVITSTRKTEYNSVEWVFSNGVVIEIMPQYSSVPSHSTVWATKIVDVTKYDMANNSVVSCETFTIK